ncbi:hypothetical protein [Streptomyces sp. NPDC053048]|uniref:hypothetical protein n=1 Tax=Streptomyces sp. NPDC053048 TaxID=3365694 RepID=UPI0037D6B1CE
MRYDEALIGHWSSAPFDYGVMESSDLAFLPDGRGWGVLANLAGMEVVRFRWHCPGPGLLEIRDEHYAQGQWDVDTDGFSSVEETASAEYVTLSRYTIGPEEAAVGEPRQLTAVTFEETVMGAFVYARGAREIEPTQDPSYSLFPYT